MINERCFRIKKNGEPNYICYCTKPELIENYDLAIADKQNIWICHHRKEEFYTSKELIEMGIYFNVPPEDLVFCKNAYEHRKYPHKGDEKIAEAKKGKKMSKESCKRMSEAKKGKPTWSKGKKMSEESKRKNSEAHKGKPAWNKGLKGYKVGPYKKKGLHWYNNGIIDKLSITCPEGFVPGRLHHK